MNKVFPYVFWITLSLVAGGIGSYFSFDGITTWYAGLIKPSWTPPNYVFGPVWTFLYVCMGSAAALVTNSVIQRKSKKYVLRLFAIHLLVNAAWSYVFFGLQSSLLALIIICVLWIYVFLLMLLFSTYSRRAAALMFPYLLWVSYATTLNAGILYLNP